MMRLFALLLLGCPADVDPDDTADTDPNAFPGTLPAPDCSAYAYGDAVYDCTQLDRCDTSAENLSERLACCECDPRLCQASDDCPPPVG